MKPRWTLSRKILCLALANVALLAAALAAFAAAQFRVGPESLLLGPAHDRIRGIADAFTNDLDAAPEDARAAVLDTYANRYGAEFYLVAGRGEPILGAEAPMASPLLEEMRRLLPPPGNRPPALRRRGGSDGPISKGKPRRRTNARSRRPNRFSWSRRPSRRATGPGRGFRARRWGSRAVSASC